MSQDNRAAISTRLEIPAENILHAIELDNGPVFQVMQLDAAATVLALDSSRVRWPEFKSLG